MRRGRGGGGGSLIFVSYHWEDKVIAGYPIKRRYLILKVASVGLERQVLESLHDRTLIEQSRQLATSNEKF